MMKRRDFLRVSAIGAGQLGALALVYPVVEPILEGELLGPEQADFPVDVRIMGYSPDDGYIALDGLTDWFKLRNGTPQLCIESMRECMVAGTEARIDLGPHLTGEDLIHTMWCPLPRGPTHINKGDNVTVHFQLTGIIDLRADAG